MSTNLAIPALTGGQANPETTVNDASGAIDAAITETLTVDLTNSVLLTSAQYRSAVRFSVTPAGASKTLTLPAVKRLVLIDNFQATNAITIKVGTTSFSLAVSTATFVYTDGTTNGLEQLAIGGGSGGASSTFPFDITVFNPGVSTNAQTLLRFNVTRAFTWPISLTGSVFSAGVAATASTTYTIKQNGSSIGTLVWAIAGTTPTITFASAVTFAVNDVITLTGPTTADATLADISFNFQGSRAASTSLEPHDTNVFVGGKPGAAATIFRQNQVRASVLKSGLTGSVFNAGTASAASAVFTIKLNGSSIGTITFSTSATGVASFTTDVFLVANDLLTIVAPTSQDSTLADVALNFLGSR